DMVSSCGEWAGFQRPRGVGYRKESSTTPPVDPPHAISQLYGRVSAPDVQPIRQSDTVIARSSAAHPDANEARTDTDAQKMRNLFRRDAAGPFRWWCPFSAARTTVGPDRLRSSRRISCFGERAHAEIHLRTSCVIRVQGNPREPMTGRRPSGD